MIWFVVTTTPTGVIRREFDSLAVARLWEIGMAALGYVTSEPRPVLKAVAS